MDKICYLCAACCSHECESIKKRPQDYIIAVDKGYQILKENNIYPDMVVGDFDSLSYVPEHPNIIMHPARKDDTDTFLSVSEGMKMGYKNFVILGGIGGNRPDHTMANIQTLIHIAKMGGRGVMLGKNRAITAICDDKILLPYKQKGYVSVFALGADAKNVCIEGLKYKLHNATLNCAIPLGVSNEFIGSENAFVSVSDGILVLMWNENTKKLLSNINFF